MKKLVYSSQMKGQLDDDYTLFDNGDVLHEYDKHTYPGGFNLKETLKASELNQEIKERLLNAASDEVKLVVKELLGL